MKTQISITDFTFNPAGYGHYTVTYTSPVTGKQWQCTVDAMPLIDSTKGKGCDAKKGLNPLETLC